MATTRYRSSMQTRHENTGTGRPTVMIHAVTQWLSHSNALQWDSLHKLRNIGFSNTYTSLSRFIWNIAMWPMAKAIPAKKYHNSPTGANVPWRKAKAPVPPVAPLLIHAWTELTEFLYISCRKKLLHPFWRPVFWHWIYALVSGVITEFATSLLIYSHRQTRKDWNTQ